MKWLHARSVATAGAALLVSCAPPPQPAAPGAGPVRQDVEAAEWVNEVLPRLSLEDRVAQMIFVAAEGGFVNARAAAARQLDHWVDELHVGGVLVGPGTPLEVALRLNALQARAPLPLLVAADVEWGAARVLPGALIGEAGRGAGATSLPSNMGLAASGSPLNAELAGRVTAREARAVGIHWLLAPVVDAAAPEGDVLARSFSPDPTVVARFGDAWVRGARSAGALTTLRHFPGEGSAALPADDAALPVIATERAALEQQDLVPFGAIARAGADAIMVSAAAVPAYTGDRTTPAFLASEIVNDLLRRRLGFAGLISTPPLSAELHHRLPSYAPAEVAVQAVLAGADVLLAPGDPAAVHRALVTAVRSGRIPYRRLDLAVRRILLAKARVGLATGRAVLPDSVSAIVAAPEHEDMALRLAAESITLARDSAALVPLDPRRVQRLALVAVAAPEAVAAGERLAAELRATYGSGVSFDRVTPLSAEHVVDAAVTHAGLAEATVLALFTPLDAPAQRTRLRALAKRLAARMRGVNPRLVLAGFGDPLGGEEVAYGGTYILGWQPHGESAQIAMARALAGRAPITGRLPLPLRQSTAGAGQQRTELDFRLRNGTPQSVGLDSTLLRRIDEIMARGLAGGAAPGAAIAVGRQGRLVLLRGYGKLDLRRGFEDASDSTIYDLASLTKVIGTTSALAISLDRGLIDLDAPVQRYIPEWKGSRAKEAVTLRNLVLHNAGLAAYSPLYRTLRGRAEYRRAIAGMELQYAPGTRTVYSDFGIMLLGFILEQVTGQPLDEFLEQELFGPLGMRDSGFNPLRWPYGAVAMEDQSGEGAPPWLLHRIAPTELDTLFRFTRVHGRVHDENAYAVGGVSGHAGLFSSARDLAVFAQLMLDRGFYGGRRYFDPATVAQFTRRAAPGSSRAIGWDTPSENSSAGDYFSSRSFGHTGFTGTSIWIDPERDLFVVLLTNRVNFGRDNQKHVALRRDIADAVALAIRDVTVAARNDGPLHP